MEGGDGGEEGLEAPQLMWEESAIKGLSEWFSFQHLLGE